MPCHPVSSPACHAILSHPLHAMPSCLIPCMRTPPGVVPPGNAASAAGQRGGGAVWGDRLPGGHPHLCRPHQPWLHLLSPHCMPEAAILPFLPALSLHPPVFSVLPGCPDGRTWRRGWRWQSTYTSQCCSHSSQRCHTAFLVHPYAPSLSSLRASQFLAKQDVEEGVEVTVNIYISVLLSLITARGFEIFVHPVPSVIPETRPLAHIYNATLRRRCLAAAATPAAGGRLHMLDFFNALLTDDQAQAEERRHHRVFRRKRQEGVRVGVSQAQIGAATSGGGEAEAEEAAEAPAGARRGERNAHCPAPCSRLPFRAACAPAHPFLCSASDLAMPVQPRSLLPIASSSLTSPVSAPSPPLPPVPLLVPLALPVFPLSHLFSPRSSAPPPLPTSNTTPPHPNPSCFALQRRLAAKKARGEVVPEEGEGGGADGGADGGVEEEEEEEEEEGSGEEEEGDEVDGEEGAGFERQNERLLSLGRKPAAAPVGMPCRAMPFPLCLFSSSFPLTRIFFTP
ncbi:unnamed protein product [Closterium sp. NIES-54]